MLSRACQRGLQQATIAQACGAAVQREQSIVQNERIALV
jgi:hypothetical protein